MADLCKLPNIGKALEERLSDVGINSIESLMKMGSKEAFTKLHLVEGYTCFNTLCALEGAVQGIRWHNLSSETKEDLKKFFNLVK